MNTKKTKHVYTEWLSIDEMHEQSKNWLSELAFIKEEQQFLNHMILSIGIKTCTKNEFVKINPIIYKIFILKATIINDIYELYYNNNENKLEKFKCACIPDYKTSVMMNSLFRIIKENNNLDLLEESDDEEEFENIRLDKFVNLEKKMKMKCVYMKKFNSWKPIEISNDNVSPKREITCYKK